MVQLERLEISSVYNSEQEGLSLIAAEVPIDCLSLTPQLAQRFPKEYDPAIVKQLAQTIQNGVVTPHALVVKEMFDGKQTTHLELLQKPAVVFALKQCGIAQVKVVIIRQNEAF